MMRGENLMTDKPAHKSNRRGFWPGLLIGVVLGMGLLFLAGLLLWSPPF